jgi:hypothetical protein
MPEVPGGFSVRMKEPAAPAEPNAFAWNPASNEIFDKFVFPETVSGIPVTILNFRRAILQRLEVDRAPTFTCESQADGCRTISSELEETEKNFIG